MVKEKVIVFGTGRASEHFVIADIDYELFDIVAFADNNIEKQGKIFYGKKIISPKELLEYEYDAIIIASSFYEDIKECLVKNYGINSNMIHNRYYREQEKLHERYKNYYKKHSNEITKPLDSLKKTDQIVVYTAITGEFDELKEPQYIDNKSKYICFTDQEDLNSDIWEIRKIEVENNDYNRTAKKFKVFPNLYFPDYEWSIWIDGQLQITGDLRKLIVDYKKYSNMLCFLHQVRNNIHDEAKICKKLHFDDEEVINRQIYDMEKSGFKDDNELIAGGFLVRKHHDKDIIRVMNDWWKMITKGSRRDQLSFNYVAWKNQFFFDVTDLNIMDNIYFKRYVHKKIQK